jgi:hypothetical protein
VLRWPRARAKQGAHWRQQWWPRRGSVSRASRGEEGAFIAGHKWRRCVTDWLLHGTAWAQYGRGTVAMCSGRQANGGARAARCGQCARTTWLGVGPTDIAHRDHGAQRMDLWTRASLGVRVRRRTAASRRDRARRRARGASARSGAQTVQFSPV